MVIVDDPSTAGSVPLSQPTALALQEFTGGAVSGTQLYPLASAKRYDTPTEKKGVPPTPALASQPYAFRFVLDTSSRLVSLTRM